jgi:predicted RNase H-like HicB family nuclease
MQKVIQKKGRYTLPILIERDEDGFFVVECPVFTGCYTQGKTMDEALKNIEEVIELCMEEKENRELLKNYGEKHFTFTTITV